MTDGIIQEVFKKYINTYPDRYGYKILQQELIEKIKEEFDNQLPKSPKHMVTLYPIMVKLIGDNQE